MSYYRPCPLCGAALDPGEVCTDCREEQQHQTGTKVTPKSARKTAPDATNIESGKAESELSDPHSASILTNT